jgi:nucleotide-binding universal stress UspA family protein
MALLTPPSKILVPVDFSKRSEIAVGYGAMLADRLGGELVVMTNLNLPEQEALEGLVASSGVTVEEAAHLEMSRAVAELGPQVTAVTVVARRDFPSDGILEVADSCGAGMIVIGSHGRSRMSRWLLGSVAEKVARIASVPVVIVPVRDCGDQESM